MNPFFVLCLMLIISSACDEEQIIPGGGITDKIPAMDAMKGARVNQNPFKIKGSVELIWKGKDRGNPLSGKKCRIGQLIVLKTHDGGKPWNVQRGITWKWFDPLASNVPDIEHTSAWPHLCIKNIIGGNIVVHIQ